MLKANYHTHTSLCHHASGEMREYIENAIKAGLKTLGFSDHAPQIFPKEWNYYSPFRMRPEEAAGYVSSLRALAEEYRQDIQILVGFEAEYYPALFAELLRFIRPLEVDYLILGQHFLGNELGCTHSMDPTCDLGVFNAYIDQVLAGLSTGQFSYFAHPDCINFIGDESLRREGYARLCRGVAQLGIPVEINLLGLREGRHYPKEEFFRIAAECGCQGILGCDAHSPGKAADLASAEIALQMAERVGLPILPELPLRPVSAP